jgi:hypothetical protein
MSLKNEISKIKMMINEVNELKLRRVYPELRSLIQYFLQHSHPCDYDSAEHFFYGIKDEIFDDGFWLEYNLDWEDIELALLDYFREMIENHYNYECQSKMNGEIMEYPNYVYESEDKLKIPYAVFEITKPLAHMQLEYYYQEAPLWKTKEDLIYIKKGASGHKTISTQNIRVLRIFPEGETEEMYNYLEELRNKVR